MRAQFIIKNKKFANLINSRECMGYMEIMSEIEVGEEFRKKYEQNPRGWKCAQGIRNGHPELFVTNKKSGISFKVMRDSQYSGMPGVGGIINEYMAPRMDIEHYGLRPFSIHDIWKMIVGMAEGIIPIKTIMAQQPVTVSELQKTMPHVAVQGPILHIPKPIEAIIGGQLELDLKLEAELEKLTTKKISNYIM